MYKAVMKGESFAFACSKGTCGQVHSVFDKAINIEIIEENKDVSLLTLLCKDSDIMPAALVTSMCGESWREICKIGSKVIFTPDIIYLNSAQFIGGVFDAAVWRAIDPKSLTYLPQLTYKEMIVRCKQVERYIKASGKDKNDFPVMKMSDFDVFKFLGLGDGLTPSGDDFLAGMLSAMHFAQVVYARKCELLPNIVNSILQNMTTRTNQISRHFLRYASEGLWGRATEQFMMALFRCNDDALSCAVKEKLAYGATSGIDEMSGIMFGFCEIIRLFEEG